MTALLRRLFLTVSIFSLATSIVWALDPPVPDQRILTLHYEMTGESEQEMLAQGCNRVVKSAVGRVYKTGYMLRALDLLDSYINKNCHKFIARRSLNASEVRGGQRYIDLEVAVDVEKVYADLTEKQFLYRPALRPIFYIFLSETYDGSVGLSRKEAIEIARNVLEQFEDFRVKILTFQVEREGTETARVHSQFEVSGYWLGSGVYNRVPLSGGIPRPVPGEVDVRFVKSGDAWLMDHVDLSVGGHVYR